MSFITPYITMNNVLLTTSGICFDATLYSILRTNRSFNHLSRVQAACAALNVVGIATIAIKEKSLQSCKWVILTSIVCSAFTTWLTRNDLDSEENPTLSPTAGFNLGVAIYASVSVLIAIGKLGANHLTRR
jgi:hypothetical protein